MKLVDHLKMTHLLAELLEDRLVLAGTLSVGEVALEREKDGTLTPACRERILSAVSEVQGELPRWAATMAYCGIPARGVSLRLMRVPACKPENLPALLRFQIEKEFPVSIGELTWGYRVEQAPPQGGQQVLVAAVKKQRIRAVADVLVEAGLTPVFTLGILAASSLCRPMPGAFELLNTDSETPELLSFEEGIPVSVRCLPKAGTLTDTVRRQVAQPGHLFLMGAGVDPEMLQSAEPGAPGCEVLQVAGSAVIAGLRRQVETRPEPSLLEMAWGKPKAARRLDFSAVPPKWAAITVALLLGLLATRYAEAWIKAPGLQAQLQRIEEEKAGLPAIDKEVRFLQYVQKHQPPYLAALTLIADSATQGTVIDSLTLDSRGAVSFRAVMKTSQQATEMRRKMLDTGLFNSIVLEEQSPVKRDRPEVNVRFRARWQTSRDYQSKVLRKIDASLPPADSKPSRTPGGNRGGRP